LAHARKIGLLLFATALVITARSRAPHQRHLREARTRRVGDVSRRVKAVLLDLKG